MKFYPCKEIKCVIVFIIKLLPRDKLNRPSTKLYSIQITDFSHQKRYLLVFQRSGLSFSLPENVKLLSLEQWDDSSVLLRLEHTYEIHEHPEYGKPVNVSIQVKLTCACHFLKIPHLREVKRFSNTCSAGCFINRRLNN